MTAPPHHNTTSSSLARVYVAAARLLHVPPEGYVGLLGLAPEHLNDDMCRTPTSTVVRLAELATARAPWTMLSLALAKESRFGALGAWDYLVPSAPTPLEGLRDASDCFASVGDPSTDALGISEDGRQITVGHVNQADVAYEAGNAISAYALGVYLQRLSSALQRDLAPLRVTLAAETPRRHDSLIELFGTRAIEFEAPVSSLTFLASDLESPNPAAQPGLSAVLKRHAEQTLAASVPLHGWLDLFRATLASAYEESTPTLAAVARRMAAGTRTVQRRLEEHGTTWNGELDSLRRSHVTRLLRGTGLGVERVAARSGYADARALRRGVKRWYGTPPAALRRGPLPRARQP
ncbi:AraC family transcriptional regulator ligand-binding domain-containing protein [Streptomyces sp. CC53]|uniref:AraC family transcriptional regulator n=1 Tax=Streptomyces sp. CC53 TaxID=1906740 RepID=UPI00115F8F68|nr:AraC family transcriptional regulator ligand-binding domain-containing protein [Streptomyces sp. CC53]